MAAAFFGRLVEKNPEVTVSNVDLYETPPPYLSLDGYNRFWKPVTVPDYKPTKAEENAITYATAQSEGLLQADVLVLTMPMWCGGPPAIMKAWLDQVISPGLIFNYGPEGAKPLHQLRKVVLLVASGHVYKEADPRDGITPIIQNTFGFIGVTDIAVAWAEGQDPFFYSDHEERKQNAMEAAQDIADEIAELP
jgi:FMN-dependent NADH-azoreductase